MKFFHFLFEGKAAVKIRLFFALFLLPFIFATAWAAEFQIWREAIHHPQTVIRLKIGEEGNESQWQALPKELLLFNRLEGLKLVCMEKLQGLPSEISQLKGLRVLEADNGNGCTSNLTLPDSIGQLNQLKMLILYGALDGSDPDHPQKKGKSLPDAVFRLTGLEVLNLGRNGMGTVPEKISLFTQLKRLNLEYNALKGLPASFGNLKNLTTLSLNGNSIHSLPAGLADIPNLKIELGNNSLTLEDQKKLQAQFPKAVFSFENEFDDASSNQEAAPVKK